MTNNNTIDDRMEREVADHDLKFSGYNFGYYNKKGIPVPAASVDCTHTPLSVYYYITREYAKEATQKLRDLPADSDSQAFKILNFRGVTFSGLFKYRSAKDLLRHNGLMVIDIDHIASHKRLMEIRQMLIDDHVFTTILLFVSPSGNGLKWIIFVDDMNGMSHSDFFAVVRSYLWDTYAIEADKSGSDVCRLCYLPYDPDCYVNPQLLQDFKDQIL